MKSRERRHTRNRFAPLIAAVAAAVVLSLTGCEWIWKAPAPCTLHQPSPSQLISVVNHQSQRLQAWQCNDVKVRMHALRSLPISLSAYLAVKRSSYFRLKVGTAFSSEADFGSNKERFWFWIRQAPKKHIYYTRHEDIDVVQQRTRMPFRPDWVMDALMIPALDPATAREIPNEAPGSRYTIFLIDHAAGGSRGMQRWIWVDHCHGDVAKQVVKDARGETVATAEYLAHDRDRTTGIRMPHEIVLHWPTQEASMTITMGKITVNPVDFAPQTWRFPEYNGYSPFDMAKDGIGRSPNRPVGFSRSKSPRGGLSRRIESDRNGYRNERPVFSDEEQQQRQGPGSHSKPQRRARLSRTILPISHVAPGDRPAFADD